MEYLFWTLAGICGTPWPRRWPWPWPPGPDPDPVYKPQPDPWLPVLIASALGGIAGGLIFDRVFDRASLQAGSLGWMAATCVGAFIAGRVLSGIVDLALGRMSPRANNRG
jgi:hypothetical protein